MDDNPVNQRAARLMLERLGCRVDLAANGHEAVAQVRLLPYDMVFMDCEMPEMDGYEATAAIRRDSDEGRRLPIIAMTAKALQGDRERCLEAGMDDYVPKPVKLEDFERVLNVWGSCKSRPREDYSRRAGGSASGTAAAVPAEKPAALDPEAVARWRRLAEEMGPSGLAELVEAFVTDTTSRLEDLRRHHGAVDGAGLRATAHCLKGSSANLGAVRMTDLARELEQRGGAGELKGAGELIDQLEQEFARARVELEKHLCEGVR